MHVSSVRSPRLNCLPHSAHLQFGPPIPPFLRTHSPLLPLSVRSSSLSPSPLLPRGRVNTFVMLVALALRCVSQPACIEQPCTVTLLKLVPARLNGVVWFGLSCPVPTARDPSLHWPSHALGLPPGSLCANGFMHILEMPWKDNPLTKGCPARVGPRPIVRSSTVAWVIEV